MPTVVHDDAFASYIRSLITEHWTSDYKPRAGKWHVSDMLFPRYAVLNRLHPHSPTDEAIGFFLTGEAYHRYIQGLLGSHNSEVHAEAYGVVATADFMDGTMLIELKTSRKWTIPESPQSEYIKQSGFYSVIYNIPKVQIVAIFPVAGRKWDGSASSTVEIRAWTVTFTPEDQEAIKIEIASLVRNLTVAYKSGDVTTLPACPSWKYGTVERDSEKKEYFIKLRCIFAEEGLCDCGDEVRAECARKMANRREVKGKKFDPGLL